ncbi:MAG: hypothetical protein JNJ47_05510, partial [Alphaproteobacteria bacterium]|nr:hypothetical protein [Alphaproteobacteria bacterium]
ILPPREKFWQELPDVFSWLQEEKAKTSLKSILLPDDVDLTWNPPSMIRPWGTSIPLELIRYAGANYLCVEVEYEEELSSIEPYELKRSQEGNLFLIAIKRNAGEILPYSIDQIKKITITQEPFIPRYRVALTPIEL